MGGNLKTVGNRSNDKFSETTVDCSTDTTALGAYVPCPSTAIDTNPAPQCRVQAHMVSRQNIGHIWSNSGNDASCLMARDDGERCAWELASNNVEIRAADAACTNSN